MAAAMAAAIGGEAVAAESAGIAAIPGNRPVDEAVSAARERGFDVSRHEARYVGDLDLERYDLVVALTPSIAERLRRRYGLDEARLVALDVDDPYGGTVEEYRRAAIEIEDSVRRILREAGMV